MLTAASGPFLEDISTNPHEIAQVLAGLDSWASSWSQALSSTGPFLKLTATIPVVNTADLALALLGGPGETAALTGGLGPGLVNPPTYGSAARPPAVASTAIPTQATGQHTAVATLEPVLPEPAQQDAVSHVVTGVAGAAPTSPAVATLLLSPVLEGLVGGR